MPTQIVSKNTTGAYANTGHTGFIDTNMNGLAPTTNFASDTILTTTCWDASIGDAKNPLFKADVSAIGAGTVADAEIGFYLNGGNNDFRTISLYPLLVSFVETQATFEIRSTGNNWNTPNARGSGTDRAASAIAIATRPGTSGLWMTFTGSALNALIEDQLDGTVSNHGFTKEITDYADDLFTYQDYISSEGTDGLRPYLKFNHTPAVNNEMAAAATAIAAAAGALSTNIRLAANAVGVSVANGQLTTQVRMTAAAIAQAVSTAALSSGIQMDADAVMQAAAAGTLTTQIRMIASAAGVANATGSLGLQTTLSANAIAQAAAAAGLTTQIRLNSQAQAQASASAGLAGTAATLSGAAINIAVANGQLSTLIILDGDAISQAILAGGLTTAILLDADAAAAVIAAGNLQVGVVLDWTDIPVIGNVWYPKRTALVLLPYRNRLNLRKLH